MLSSATGALGLASGSSQGYQLTWVVPVGASLAVSTVIAAGVEALDPAHLTLSALPGALGLGYLPTWPVQALHGARAPP